MNETAVDTYKSLMILKAWGETLFHVIVFYMRNIKNVSVNRISVG
jgi:hypothetical protein